MVDKITLEYKNANEIVLEDLMGSGQLNITESDDQDVIEDAICMTLNEARAHYIRHHVDYAYSQTEEERLGRDAELMQIFNRKISIAREGEHSEWEKPSN